jgi:hypothetical protein
VRPRRVLQRQRRVLVHAIRDQLRECHLHRLDLPAAVEVRWRWHPCSSRRRRQPVRLQRSTLATPLARPTGVRDHRLLRLVVVHARRRWAAPAGATTSARTACAR